MVEGRRKEVRCKVKPAPLRTYLQSWGKQSCSRLCQRQSLMSRTQTRSLLTMQPAGTMGLSVPLWRKMSVLFITTAKHAYVRQSRLTQVTTHFPSNLLARGALSPCVGRRSLNCSQFQRTTRLPGERRLSPFWTYTSALGNHATTLSLPDHVIVSFILVLAAHVKYQLNLYSVIFLRNAWVTPPSLQKCLCEKSDSLLWITASDCSVKIIFCVPTVALTVERIVDWRERERETV